MPTVKSGHVFFTTMRLTSKLSDGSRLFGAEEGSKEHDAEASYDLIESLRKITDTHHAEAFM